MPEISRFFGIIIYIYYNDHQPPHFHAVYGEYEALFLIEDLGILSGYLPPRAFGLVTEWAIIHRLEISKVWHQATQYQKLDKIEPLK
ncbi:MAG: DUF4160 domain-containing protein [Bacteroidota bacterium]|nr:DUF4160 domain-containing protein [Bacteroidota bacterium]